MPTRFLFENAQSRAWCSGITRAVFALLLLSFALVSVAQNVSFVDNTDPRVRYSSDWFNVAGPNQYGGSAMLARDAGAAAQLTFQGIGISVFGTQGTTGGNITRSTYSVDVTSVNDYTVPPDLPNIQFQVRFYQSPVLPDGEHTLVIINRNPDSFYWLDFLEITSAGFQTVPPTPSPGPLNPEIQPTTPSSFSIQPTAAPDNSQTMSVSSTSGFTTTTASTQRAAATQSNSHSTVASGAAAGIAVSSIVLVSAGVFALWLRTRRRVKKRCTFEAGNIEPFDRNSTPGGFIQGATTPYRVEHFPGPGTPSHGTPPFLPPEKQPVITSSQPLYLLDYEHHGPGLPPGAGTPHLRVDPDMYPSFTSMAGNQYQPTPPVRSTETPTNYATHGSSINAEVQRTGRPTAATGRQSESQQQQRPPAFKPRSVVLS